MTDRELLELAAKAAGIDARWFDGWNGFFIHLPHQLPTYWPKWSPLTDDGDALRLAVKLGLNVNQWPDEDGTGSYCAITDFITETHNSDPYAATRRAIVRAAAEIGKEQS